MLLTTHHIYILLKIFKSLYFSATGNLMKDLCPGIGHFVCVCIVVKKWCTVKWRVNYLLTEVVQSNKFYTRKVLSCGCYVWSWSYSWPRSCRTLCLRNTTSFIPPRHWKSRGTSHNTTVWLIALLISFKAN